MVSYEVDRGAALQKGLPFRSTLCLQRKSLPHEQRVLLAFHRYCPREENTRPVDYDRRARTVHPLQCRRCQGLRHTMVRTVFSSPITC